MNATLGLARSFPVPQDLGALLQKIQEQLFTLGAVLATPQGTKAAAQIPTMKPEWVQDMEKAIDTFEAELPKMTHFILPGGNQASSALHVSRTVCRRAERRVVPLIRYGKVSADVGVYLNRLSDLLFVMARVANHRAGVADVKWIPEKP